MTSDHNIILLKLLLTENYERNPSFTTGTPKISFLTISPHFGFEKFFGITFFRQRRDLQKSKYRLPIVDK